MKIKKKSVYANLLKEIKEGKFEKCENHFCQNKTNLTIDHIIPIEILQSFNLFDEIFEWKENFQIICKSCNFRKRNLLDLTNPKTIILLKEIMKKYV